MAMIQVERQGQQVRKRAASYEAYLALPDDGRLVEWADGEIIEHMPATTTHQNIVIFLASLMRAFVERLALGKVLAAPLEVKLWPGGPSREPDVLFVARGGQAQVDDKRVRGAPDLVIEVVSPGSVTLDRITKFREYERAGVREYWIIDPRTHQQQADFYMRDEEGHFVPAPVGDDGVYHCAVLPGFRLRPDWFRLTGPDDELPDFDLPLAEMLADAPGLPDDLRAAYRQLAQLLSGA